MNKHKSEFIMYSKDDNFIVEVVRAATGFVKGSFPLTYLGYLISHGKLKKCHFSGLIKKVQNKLQEWKGKMLSFGGKTVLINSVLNSIPIYLICVINPPKNVIHDLEKIFARFFWNVKETGRSKHWVNWADMYKPKEEGGLGFRSLGDVGKATIAKLWWIFRIQKSLWTNFMWKKYCKIKRTSNSRMEGWISDLDTYVRSQGDV